MIERETMILDENETYPAKNQWIREAYSGTVTAQQKSRDSPHRIEKYFEQDISDSIWIRQPISDMARSAHISQ